MIRLLAFLIMLPAALLQYHAVQAEAAGNDDLKALFSDTRALISAFRYDSAAQLLDRAEGLARAAGDPYYLAEAVYLKSLIMSSKGSYLEALSLAGKYLDAVAGDPDQARLGKAYYHLGNLLYTQGESDSAIRYISKSLEINRTLNDPVRLIAGYNLLGNIFQGISENDSAIACFIQSARLAEESGQQQYLGSIYCNLGKALIGNNQLEEAGKYFDMSEQISTLNKDDQTLAIVLINLGGIAFLEEDFGKSLEYYNRAREVLAQNDNTMIRADLYNNFARFYMRRELFQAAIAYYDTALQLFTRENYTEGMVTAMMNKGWAHSRANDLQLADQLLTSALSLAKPRGFTDERLWIHFYLAKNNYAAGQYKAAYEYFEKYSKLYDSAYTLEKTTALNHLRHKYEKGLDEARILNLEKESLQKSIQRNRTITISMILLALSFYIFLVVRNRLVRARIAAQEKILHLEEQEKLVAAGKLAEGQEEERRRVATELHDGLGVLLSATKMHLGKLKEDLRETNPVLEKSIAILDQAAAETRRISHNMMPGLLTRFGFFEAIQELFEQIEESGTIGATCTIEGNTGRMQENIEIMLYRIVQEMVNNSLKYAKAGSISLHIRVNVPVLQLFYEDNGVGFSVDEVNARAHQSIGLKSIDARVAFLRGSMNLETAPGKGTRYAITVPGLELQEEH